jgi:hypothetical protein
MLAMNSYPHNKPNQYNAIDLTDRTYVDTAALNYEGLIEQDNEAIISVNSSLGASALGEKISCYFENLPNESNHIKVLKASSRGSKIPVRISRRSK